MRQEPKAGEGDVQRTAVGHGIAGVEREVDEGLLEASGIALDGEVGRIRGEGEPNVLGQGAPQCGKNGLDGSLEVEGLERGDGTTAEVQNLLDEIDGLVRLPQDRLQGATYLGREIRLSL